MNSYLEMGFNKFLQKLSLQPREYLSASDSQANSPSGRVSYDSQTPSARSFTAVVSTSKGDGTFLSIQEAINAVNKLGGGTVFIKAGTYTMGTSLTLYSNIKILGEDRDNTIIDFNGGAFGFRAIGTLTSQLRNIELRDVLLKGSEYIDEGTIRMNYCNDCIIDNVKLSSNSPVNNAPDINLNNPTRIYIHRCSFSDGPPAIQLRDFSLCTVAECYFSAANQQCIQPFNGTGLIIRDNVFLSSEDYSIYSDGAPAGLFIANNVINQQNKEGIYIDAPTDYQIVGNYVVGPGDDDGTYNGITLVAGSRAVVVGNIVKDFAGTSSSDGIELSNMDNCVIDGNVCTGNGGYGINIATATCDKNIVTSNQLLGNTTGALQDLGTATTSANNVIV